jgi:hypothetical protein
MVSLWCGANRYVQLDVARFDYSLQRLFGWDRMPEHKAFQRYFDKFNMESALQIFGALYHWFFSGLKFDNFTMNIDSSVLTLDPAQNRFPEFRLLCPCHSVHWKGNSYGRGTPIRTAGKVLRTRRLKTVITVLFIILSNVYAIKE